MEKVHAENVVSSSAPPPSSSPLLRPAVSGAEAGERVPLFADEVSEPDQRLSEPHYTDLSVRK